LRDGNIGLHEVVVYQTTETPVAMDAKFDGILFFSPSAVRSFFSMNQLDPQSVCFAIGTTTADEIKNHSGNRIVVSECTSQESMVSTLYQFYRN
jgi:uroporphyrinogen-III synthase